MSTALTMNNVKLMYGFLNTYIFYILTILDLHCTFFTVFCCYSLLGVYRYVNDMVSHSPQYNWFKYVNTDAFEYIKY